jgi:oxepin-CoA hydrolase/3-oxo-5,6-dehydrosuberyl-CoA semialdehyde dehydrogenase
VREVVREMTTKAGQKCTAIRRAIVPTALAGALVEALSEALAKVVVGDPRRKEVRMGPVVSGTQRDEVLARVRELTADARVVHGDPERFEVSGADARRGAFVPPMLLLCRDAMTARAVHHVRPSGRSRRCSVSRCARSDHAYAAWREAVSRLHRDGRRRGRPSWRWPGSVSRRLLI